MIRTGCVKEWGRTRAFSALTLIGLAICGCGSGAPSVSSSRTEATVHGKVTINGKAPATGEVTFDPSNVRRRDAPVNVGPIGKDGTYSVRTLVGSNNVHVNSPEVSKDQKLMYVTIPLEVQSGDNPFDITLPLPPSP